MLNGAIGDYFSYSHPPMNTSLEDETFLILKASMKVPNFKILSANGSESYLSFPYSVMGPPKSGVNAEFLKRSDMDSLQGCKAHAKVAKLSWLFVNRKQIWSIACENGGIEFSLSEIESHYTQGAITKLIIGLVLAAIVPWLILKKLRWI